MNKYKKQKKHLNDRVENLRSIITNDKTFIKNLPKYIKNFKNIIDDTKSIVIIRKLVRKSVDFNLYNELLNNVEGYHTENKSTNIKKRSKNFDLSVVSFLKKNPNIDSMDKVFETMWDMINKDNHKDLSRVYIILYKIFEEELYNLITNKESSKIHTLLNTMQFNIKQINRKNKIKKTEAFSKMKLNKTNKFNKEYLGSADPTKHISENTKDLQTLKINTFIDYDILKNFNEVNKLKLTTLEIKNINNHDNTLSKKDLVNKTFTSNRTSYLFEMWLRKHKIMFSVHPKPSITNNFFSIIKNFDRNTGFRVNPIIDDNKKIPQALKNLILDQINDKVVISKQTKDNHSKYMINIAAMNADISLMLEPTLSLKNLIIEDIKKDDDLNVKILMLSKLYRTLYKIGLTTYFYNILKNNVNTKHYSSEKYIPVEFFRI